MWQTLIPAVKTILSSVSEIEAANVYGYPETHITGYPTAIVLPNFFGNQYLSTSENRKSYQFKIWLVYETKRIGIDKAWQEAMPELVDAVVKAFDDAWDGGVIGTHRVWYLVENGDWFAAKTQGGVELTAELNLTINLATSVA